MLSGGVPVDETQTSFIWSLAQIAEVKRRRVHAFVDVRVIHSAPPGFAVDETKDRLWRMMRELAHPLGLEVDSTDLEFGEAEESDFLIKVSGRWNPASKEVEFRGGPHDGEILNMPRAGEMHVPIHFAVPLGPTGQPRAKTSSPKVEIRKLSYWLTGWSERDHRWIYQQR